MERKKVEMLFLSEPDMIEAGVLDVKHCVETMDETIRLLGEGDYVQEGTMERITAACSGIQKNHRSRICRWKVRTAVIWPCRLTWEGGSIPVE